MRRIAGSPLIPDELVVLLAPHHTREGSIRVVLEITAGNMIPGVSGHVGGRTRLKREIRTWGYILALNVSEVLRHRQGAYTKIEIIGLLFPFLDYVVEFLFVEIVFLFLGQSETDDFGKLANQSSPVTGHILRTCALSGTNATRVVE